MHDATTISETPFLMYHRSFERINFEFSKGGYGGLNKDLSLGKDKPNPVKRKRQNKIEVDNERN